MAPTGEPAAELYPRGQRHPLPGIPTVECATWPKRRVRREDLQATPRHEDEEWHVQPVRQTDEPWLGAPALPPLSPIGCCHGLLLVNAGEGASPRPAGCCAARIGALSNPDHPATLPYLFICRALPPSIIFPSTIITWPSFMRISCPSIIFTVPSVITLVPSAMVISL